MSATLILDDPLANSYLQNLYAPDPDLNMTVIEYERSFEQNEDLGLNDLRLEDYDTTDPPLDDGEAKPSNIRDAAKEQHTTASYIGTNEDNVDDSDED